MQDNFEIRVANQVINIKMTYGLLTEIAGTIGTVENVAMMTMDHAVRDKVISILLSKRDERGRVVEAIEASEVQASAEDIAQLLDWAQEHVMDFFLTLMERTRQMVEKTAPRIKGLMPTSTGGPG